MLSTQGEACKRQIRPRTEPCGSPNNQRTAGSNSHKAWVFEDKEGRKSTDSTTYVIIVSSHGILTKTQVLDTFQQLRGCKLQMCLLLISSDLFMTAALI